MLFGRYSTVALPHSILMYMPQINWIGSAIFTFFVLAFGFYLWVRITKTMDLGKYLAYGIFVLVVEVRRATLLKSAPAMPGCFHTLKCVAAVLSKRGVGTHMRLWLCPVSS